MAIDDLDKIDPLVTDKEKNFVRLIIADHLDWEEFDEGDHLELLQDKINAYLHFVEDGQLIRTRPDLEGCLSSFVSMLSTHPARKLPNSTGWPGLSSLRPAFPWSFTCRPLAAVRFVIPPF